MGENVSPKTGGGGNLKSPVTGGGDRNKTPTNPLSRKAAPGERVGVRKGSTPRKVQTGGQTSMIQNKKVDPVQPPKGNQGRGR